jgi:hypothetical protein
VTIMAPTKREMWLFVDEAAAHKLRRRLDVRQNRGTDSRIADGDRHNSYL